MSGLLTGGPARHKEKEREVNDNMYDNSVNTAVFIVNIS